MKKIIAIAMALAMMMAIVACGSPSAGGSSNETQAVTEAATEAATEGATETEVQEESAAVELGTIEGSVYENEFLGIGAKLPDDWTFSTAEEIAEINGIVVDSLNDEKMKEAIEKNSQFYDMMAASEDQLSNINIVVQELGVLQGLAISDMEESLKASEDATVKALEDMGAEDVVFEIDRGQEFPAEGYSCGVIKSKIMGLEMNQRLILFKTGNYMATVTVTAIDRDDTKEILDCFYSLK